MLGETGNFHSQLAGSRAPEPSPAPRRSFTPALGAALQARTGLHLTTDTDISEDEEAAGKRRFGVTFAAEVSKFLPLFRNYRDGNEGCRLTNHEDNNETGSGSIPLKQALPSWSSS